MFSHMKWMEKKQSMQKYTMIVQRHFVLFQLACIQYSYFPMEASSNNPEHIGASNISLSNDFFFLTNTSNRQVQKAWEEDEHIPTMKNNLSILFRNILNISYFTSKQ